MTFADTSFLLSLEGNDAHTPTALAHALALKEPILVSELTILEFENAVRLLRYRSLITSIELGRILKALTADVISGRLVEVSGSSSKVIARARSMSAARTESEGHRPMDILLVAAAIEAGADTFLTFDVKQGDLARALGLAVKP